MATSQFPLKGERWRHGHPPLYQKTSGDGMATSPFYLNGNGGGMATLLFIEKGNGNGMATSQGSLDGIFP